MANVQLKGKFTKRPRMQGKQYDVGKLINDQKVYIQSLTNMVRNKQISAKY